MLERMTRAPYVRQDRRHSRRHRFCAQPLKTALEQAGHRAITMRSAVELLAKVRADLDHVDLVVVDLPTSQAPGMDLVRGLRKIVEGRLPCWSSAAPSAAPKRSADSAALGVAGYVNGCSAVQHILPSLAPHLFPDSFNRRGSPRVVVC